MRFADPFGLLRQQFILDSGSLGDESQRGPAEHHAGLKVDLFTYPYCKPLCYTPIWGIALTIVENEHLGLMNTWIG